MHHQVQFTSSGIVYRPAKIFWREYAEDMGNTVSGRETGDPDPMGGLDCGHPALNGADNTNAAQDHYAIRHNGFMYFPNVIDYQTRCDAHVVPLGTVSVGTSPGSSDQFAGHFFTGPNISNFGYSPILGVFHLQTPPATTGVYPGGGQVAAVLFNSKFIQPGSVNTTGQYNHYSALRS